MGVLTDRIKNKLERSNLIDEHALNREPIPLSEQISPPSLVCKQNSSHVHYLYVGIFFNWIALGIHLCKTSQLFILKTRLGGEIYLSDINMHIRAIRNEKDIDLVKYQTHA